MGFAGSQRFSSAELVVTQCPPTGAGAMDRKAENTVVRRKILQVASGGSPLAFNLEAFYLVEEQVFDIRHFLRFSESFFSFVSDPIET